MEWEFDEITRKGTLHVNKGGPIDHSQTQGGNTVNLDSAGQIVSVVFANPVATMNMNMGLLPRSVASDAYRLMSHYALFGKKPSG